MLLFCLLVIFVCVEVYGNVQSSVDLSYKSFYGSNANAAPISYHNKISNSWNSVVISRFGESVQISMRRSVGFISVRTSHVLSIGTPTEFPTYAPSPFPTILTTNSPIILPTEAPPTFQPTFEHTSIPTNLPTFSPTVSPTLLPSEFPTALPSPIPTLSPTAAVTNSLTSAPTGPLPIDVLTVAAYYQALLLNFSSAYSSVNSTAMMTSYGAIFDGTLSQVFTPFDGFTAFATNLATLNIANQPISILGVDTACNDLSCNSPVINSYLCTDLTAVGLLWKSLVFSIESSVNCDNIMWRAQYCSGANSNVTMCVSADNHLVIRSENSVMGSDYAFGNLFSFIYESGSVIYPLWKQDVSADVNIVTISYQLSIPGFLICGAFATEQVSMTSVKAIRRMSSNAASVTIVPGMSLSGNLLLTGMNSDQDYYVYCYTQSLSSILGLQYRSSIQDALSRVSMVHTLCCDTAQFVLSVPSTMVTPSTSVIPISLSLVKYVPSTSRISFVPDVRYLNIEDCGNSNALTLLSEASSYSWTSIPADDIIVPNQVLFTMDAFNNAQQFFVRFPLEGCYSIAMNLNQSSNHLKYAVTTNLVSSTGSSFSNLVVLSFSAPSVSALSISSCELLGIGLQMIITFSFDTDLGLHASLPGRLQASFPCNLLLDYPGVELSTCVFTSATSILASIAYCPNSNCDNYFPLVNDQIRVLGSAIKPLCTVSSVEACDNFPYFPETVYPVHGNLLQVTPSVVINAPNNVFLHQDDITIDISLSAGNGGRSWKNITWNVMVNPDNATAVAAIIHTLTNFSWSVDLTNVIPSNVITASGTYVFMVSLTNSFGFKSSALASVTVIDRRITPIVSIVGRKSYAIYSNQILTLQALAAHLPLSAVTFSWLVYRDDIVDNTVVDLSVNDARKFVVGKFGLLPGHEYRFSVCLSSAVDQSTSVDEVVVFVMPVSVSVVIPETFMSLHLSQNLLLDATQSTSSDPRCAATLQYAWSCSQLHPVQGISCDGFYEISAAAGYLVSEKSVMTSLVLLHDISQIFKVNDELMFTATVWCDETGVTGTSSIQVNVVTPILIAPPVISIQPPSQNWKLDNTFKSSIIGGTVNCSTSCVAEWTIYNFNQTLSVVTLNPGLSYAPFIAAPNSLPSGMDLTFQLSVSYPGFESAAVSRILVHMNSPPTSGSVRCIPGTGDTATSFAISASNWQDIDLPITYTFFEAVDAVDDSTYQILRTNSLIPSAISHLVAGVGTNNSKYVIASIFDVYNCEARYSSKVIVGMKTNASDIDSILDLSVAILQQNSDVILAKTNTIMNTLGPHGFNCSSPLLAVTDKVTCSKLVDGGISALTYVFKYLDSNPYLAVNAARWLATLTASAHMMGDDVIVKSCNVLNNLAAWTSTVSSNYANVPAASFMDTYLLSAFQLMQQFTRIPTRFGLTDSVSMNAMSSQSRLLLGFGLSSRVRDIEESIVQTIDKLASNLLVGECLSSNQGTLKVLLCKESVGTLSAFDGLIRSKFLTFGQSNKVNASELLAINIADDSILNQAMSLQVALYSNDGLEVASLLNVSSGSNVRSIVKINTLSPQRSSIETIARVQMRYANMENMVNKNISSNEVVNATVICDDTDSNSPQYVSFTCTSAMTRGEPFTFNKTECPRRGNTSEIRAVVFYCPIYSEEYKCLDILSQRVCDLVISNSTGKAEGYCVCPLQFSESTTSTANSQAYGTSGSVDYKLSNALEIASRPILSHVSGVEKKLFPVPIPSTPISTHNPSILTKIIAAAVIFVVLLIFGTIAYYKLAANRSNTPVMCEEDFFDDIPEYKGYSLPATRRGSEDSSNNSGDGNVREIAETSCGLSAQWLRLRNENEEDIELGLSETRRTSFVASTNPCDGWNSDVGKISSNSSHGESSDHPHPDCNSSSNVEDDNNTVHMDSQSIAVGSVVTCALPKPIETVVVGVAKPKRYYGTRGFTPNSK